MIEHGGGIRGRDIEPTLLSNVAVDAAVMQEEIFGPLLPMITYRSLDEAFAAIESREKPLVLYVFSRDRAVVRRVLANTRGRHGRQSDAHPLLSARAAVRRRRPQRVGKSHGFFGFEAFSNAQGVLDQKLKLAAIDLLTPPYAGKWKQKLIDLTVRWL